MRILNLGILAHVDAGKTTLTERLLHTTGVIDRLGSVDDGNTTTDSLALERQRGITIKAAVASFTAHDVTVNLIDTPGHPDFIAEVERVLGVLDGAVLVVSAVEGVQAQTRVLMRALQRLRIPTLLFVNKTDRRGADPARVRRELRAKLSPAAVAVDDERALAEVLAEHDDGALEAWVEGAALPCGALAAQSRRARVFPVFAGSARTGEGVDALVAGITELLPASDGDSAGPAAGTVFKIERSPSGEKVAYVRMFAGAVHARERLGGAKVTQIRVFDGGDFVPRDTVRAGEIGKLWGLPDVRIGDAVGELHRNGAEPSFAPPTLETVVVPRTPEDRGRLRVALDQLAEQDPLIGLRQQGDQLSVSLYGEVQKEVVQATLAADFGVEVAFRESTTICIERPTGCGEAFEIIDTDGNPFLATVGLRVEPGDGVTFGLEVERGSMPAAFFTAVEETVYATLEERAGHRLRGDDDPLRLLGPAEPRAPGLQQGVLEHGGRLPPAHAARAARGAAARGHGGARARAPLHARGARGHARPGAARDRAARRGAGRAGAPRRRGDARGQRPGRARARAAHPAARPDARRGAAGERVRPLRAGQRASWKMIPSAVRLPAVIVLTPWRMPTRW